MAPSLINPLKYNNCWLIDAGNTCVKIYQCRRGKISLLALESSSKNQSQWQVVFKALVSVSGKRNSREKKSSLPEAILYSAVWGRRRSMFHRALKTLGCPVFAIGKEFNVPITTTYSPVDSLGSDRFLAAYAALMLSAAASEKSRANHAVAVFGFGTALTVDVIKNGVHQGGLIGPGLPLLAKAFSLGTQQLPEGIYEDLNHTVFPAKSTAGCIQAGMDAMVCGLINESLVRLPKNCHIYFTGGFGRSYAKRFKQTYRGSLVADGLWFSWQRHLSGL